MGGGGDLVFVDGGAHAGVFSDVALACGGICYAFEPNIYLATFLKELYEDNKNLVFSQNALGTENKTAMFYNCANDLTSQGNSIIRANDAYNDGYAVQVIDFCEFLQKIITKHKNISLIKLDIEGAEFDILERLIELDLHEKIEYIMVETHERYFDDGAQKMQKLKNLINSKNIKNIFLDWV